MKANIEIIRFEVDDIITTSTTGGLEDGKEGGTTGDVNVPDPVANIYG